MKLDVDRRPGFTSAPRISNTVMSTQRSKCPDDKANIARLLKCAGAILLLHQRGAAKAPGLLQLVCPGTSLLCIVQTCGEGSSLRLDESWLTSAFAAMKGAVTPHAAPSCHPVLGNVLTALPAAHQARDSLCGPRVSCGDCDAASPPSHDAKSNWHGPPHAT